MSSPANFDVIPTFEETFFELVDGIPGEKFLERFPKVLLRRVCGAALSPALRASLLASNYRLYIHFVEDSVLPNIWIPLSSLCSIVAGEPSGPQALEVSVYTRDCRFYLLEFSSVKEIARFTRFAVPFIQGLVPTERFCFKGQDGVALPWPRFEAEAMLKRQNVPAELWGACTTINANHELSPYYSPDLVLPRPLVDEVKRLNVAPNLDQLMTAAGSLVPRALQRSANCRYEQRMPVYVWGSFQPKKPTSGRVLLRSARPLSTLPTDLGASGSSSQSSGGSVDASEDLELLEAVYISALDEARPPSSVRANPAVLVFDTGAESTRVREYSPAFFKYQFLDLDVEAIKAAFDDLFMLLTSTSPSPNYFKDDRLKLWTRLINTYLDQANQIAAALNATSVMIQMGGPKFETDATLSSLVQLLVDPYFRTTEGFCALIDREWIHLSYPFNTGFRRSGPPVRDVYGRHRCDFVFFHFLHCVWEMLQQEGSRFEFSEALLAFLMDSVYDDRFGTFAFGDNRMRQKLQVPLKTASVFAFILDPAIKARFSNPSYFPSEEALEIARNPIVSFWASYLLRGHVFSDVYKQLTHSFSSLFTPSANYGPPKSAQQTYLSLDTQSLVHVFPSLLEAPYPTLLTLSLTKNNLSSFPAAFFHFPNLRSLNLSNNEFLEAPAFIGAFTSLESLDLSHNYLSSLLRVRWEGLASLLQLRLDGNKVNFLPPTLLASLSRLSILSLQNNSLASVPPKLALLKSLRALHLTGNMISFFPYSVAAALSHLRVLSLGTNRIRSLPDNIGVLVNLEQLDVSNNLLTALPVALGDCARLSVLNVSGNQLTALHASIGLNKMLGQIEASRNKLSSLPLTFGLLLEIALLNLGENLFSEYPEVLKDCRNLTDLDMHGNRLTRISDSIAHNRRLVQLNFTHNQIVEIPPTMAHLKWTIKSFALSNNPIESPPPEVVSQGTEAIMEYLWTLFSGKEPVYRVKLMIVGAANVGKTSLLRHLAAKWRYVDGKRPPEPTDQNISTDGIDIGTFEYDINPNEEKKSKKSIFKAKRKNKATVTVNVWDFAGQTIYYTTHQLFLSKRSIYIVAFDLTDPMAEESVEFWLQSLAARVKGVRIVVVGTHLDAPNLTVQIVEGRLQAMQSRFRRYLNVFQKIHYHGVSALTGEGIADLRIDLQEFMSKHKHMGKEVPKSYFFMERLLSDMKDRIQKLPVISRAQLMSYGALCGMDDPQVVAKAAKFLTQIGIVLFFGEDPLLNNLMILDPQWLTHVLASLFTTRHRFISSGILRHLDLIQIWKEYPQDLHSTLLYLLSKFEIVYQLPRHVWPRVEFLIPSKELASRATVGNLTIPSARGPVKSPSSSSNSTPAPPPSTASPVTPTSSPPPPFPASPTASSTPSPPFPATKQRSTSTARPSPTPSTKHRPTLSRQPSNSSSRGEELSSSENTEEMLKSLRDRVKRRRPRAFSTPSKQLVVASLRLDAHLETLPESVPAISTERPIMRTSSTKAPITRPRSNSEPTVADAPVRRSKSLGILSPRHSVISSPEPDEKLFPRRTPKATPGATPQLTPTTSLAAVANTTPSISPATSLNALTNPLNSSNPTLGQSPSTSPPNAKKKPKSRPQHNYDFLRTTSIKHISLKGYSLVPALLPQARPEAVLKLQWPPRVPSTHSQLSRIYVFDFIPHGLFSRLIVRSLNILTPDTLWAHGILGSSSGEGSEDKVLIESSQQPGGKTEAHSISLHVRATTVPALHKLFLLLVDALENLLGEWPNLQFIRFAVDTSSSAEKERIQEKRKSREKIRAGELKEAPEHRIPLVELEKAVLDGRREYFGSTYCVINSVAPDISLAEVDHIRVDFKAVKLGTLLGEGGFARVFRGEYEGQQVAVKILNPPKDPKDPNSLSKNFRDFRREVALHAELNHPNIIALKGVAVKPSLTMLTEFVPEGSLEAVFHSESKPFPWTLRVKIARDIASALHYLQTRNPPIVHLDIKAPNVLMLTYDPSKKIVAKLADFGTAKPMHTPLLIGRHVENPLYLAPEILANKPYDQSVDTYAFGVLLWEIHAREVFYSHLAFLSDVEDNVLEGHRPPHPPYFPAFIALTAACWHQLPSNRPTFDIILERIDSFTPSIVTNYDLDAAKWEQKRADQRKTDEKRRTGLSMALFGDLIKKTEQPPGTDSEKEDEKDDEKEDNTREEEDDDSVLSSSPSLSSSLSSSMPTLPSLPREAYSSTPPYSSSPLPPSPVTSPPLPSNTPHRRISSGSKERGIVITKVRRESGGSDDSEKEKARKTTPSLGSKPPPSSPSLSSSSSPVASSKPVPIPSGPSSPQLGRTESSPGMRRTSSAAGAGSPGKTPKRRGSVLTLLGGKKKISLDDLVKNAKYGQFFVQFDQYLADKDSSLHQQFRFYKEVVTFSRVQTSSPQLAAIHAQKIATEFLGVLGGSFNCLAALDCAKEIESVTRQISAQWTPPVLFDSLIGLISARLEDELYSWFKSE